MDSRVVLITRLRSSLGLSGDHDGLTVADVRHPDAVESTLAAVHRGGELPVVVCADADYEDVRTLLTTARVRYPGLRGLVERLPGGPMAVGVLASLIDDLSGEPHALAWQLNAIDLLREQSWSATWLPSVAGLRDPNPRLTQHVASWFSKGFLVEHHPDPRVLRAAKAPVAGLPRHEDHALLHSPVASGDRSQDDWVVGAVHDALGTRSSSDVVPVREAIDAHGSDRAIEFVTVPLAYHDDSRPDPETVVECAGCGLPHARAACPRCGMTISPALPEAQLPDAQLPDAQPAGVAPEPVPTPAPPPEGDHP